MNSRSAKRIDTTLGELIAAASEVAFEYSENDREAYRLARLALIEMLKKASHPVDLEQEFDIQREKITTFTNPLDRTK
jgi:hypothetical protein